MCPFGKEIVRETFIKGKENVSAVRRFFGFLANLLWLPCGISLFVGNLGLIVLCFVSIICIPTGIVLARSCVFLLWPVGAKVISKEQYQAVVNANEAKKFGESSTISQTGTGEFQTRTADATAVFLDEESKVGYVKVEHTLEQLREAAESEPDKPLISKEELDNFAAACSKVGSKVGQNAVIYGKKAGTAIKDYSKKTADYLQAVHEEKSKIAAEKDKSLSWREIFDGIEAGMYKNKVLAVLLSFLEWAVIAFLVLYLLIGLIGGHGISAIFMGLAKGTLIFLLLGILCMIKQNHRMAIGLFAMLTLLMPIEMICTRMTNGFTLIVQLAIFAGMLVFEVWLMKKNTPDKNVSEETTL